MHILFKLKKEIFPMVACFHTFYVNYFIMHLICLSSFCFFLSIPYVFFCLNHFSEGKVQEQNEPNPVFPQAYSPSLFSLLISFQIINSPPVSHLFCKCILLYLFLPPSPRHQSLELFCLLTTTVALHMYTPRFPLATWPQDAKQSVPLLSARASLSFTFTPKQRVTADGSKSHSTNPPYTPAPEGNSSCCFLLSRG